jgi:hypothetical protein
MELGAPPPWRPRGDLLRLALLVFLCLRSVPLSSPSSASIGAMERCIINSPHPSALASVFVDEILNKESSTEEDNFTQIYFITTFLSTSLLVSSSRIIVWGYFKKQYEVTAEKNIFF